MLLDDVEMLVVYLDYAQINMTLPKKSIAYFSIID